MSHGGHGMKITDTTSYSVNKKGESSAQNLDKTQAFAQKKAPKAIPQKNAGWEHSETMRKVEEKLADTPEVRGEKIASLRKKVSQGDYEVQPEKLAQKLLEHSLLEDLDPQD